MLREKLLPIQKFTRDLYRGALVSFLTGSGFGKKTYPVSWTSPPLVTCDYFPKSSGNRLSEKHNRMNHVWIMHICEQAPIKIDLVQAIICWQPVWLFPKSSEILRIDYLKSIIGWIMHMYEQVPSKLILCKLRRTFYWLRVTSYSWGML